jgi:hypothetical protein
MAEARGGVSKRRRAPAALVAGSAMVLLLAAVATGFALSPQARVVTAKDDAYLEASELSSLPDLLSHQRTVGYPLLLRLTRAVSPGYRALPLIQAGIFLGAVALFWLGLVRFGLGPGTALAAIAPLAASELVVPFARRVHSDTVGAALALAAIAALLFALRRPTWRTWSGLALALFLAYQVRPAYLFLLLLVPILAFILPRRQDAGERSAPAGRLAGVALALALGPFLLFCTLRLALVGHFGLVSFSGFNVVGIAASMITPEVARALPAEHQPLAETILAGRRQRGLEPIEERSFPGSAARFRAWSADYDTNIWRISGRAAFRQAFARQDRERGANAAPGPEEPTPAADVGREGARARRRLGPRRRWAYHEANRALLGLSLAVFRQRPGLYASWVVQGFRRGTLGTLSQVRGVREALAFAGLAALALAASSLKPLGGRRGAGAGRGWRRAVARSEPLCWIAAGFFAGGLALVVLVEPPFERYLWAVGLFLPAAAAALGWELGGEALSRLSSRPAPAPAELASAPAGSGMAQR